MQGGAGADWGQGSGSRRVRSSQQNFKSAAHEGNERAERGRLGFWFLPQQNKHVVKLCLFKPTTTDKLVRSINMLHVEVMPTLSRTLRRHPLHSNTSGSVTPR